MQIIGAGLNRFISDEMAGGLPPFQQRFPWYGADLQTIRNSLSRKKPQASVDERLLASIDTGGAINIAVTEPVEEYIGKVLLLIHGLGGGEDSHYMQETALFFSRLGWRVFRMNARGVGPSKATSQPPYSAGLTQDLRSVLHEISCKYSYDQLYVMGFSLGGQLLLRTLGERDVPAKITAAVSVSAPLDLAASQIKLERPRNRFYVDYLVKNMRDDLEGVKPQNSNLTLNCLKTIRDFDEYIIGPYMGFSGAEAYYAGVSCKPLIPSITDPVLAIHSDDDPWIPAEDYQTALWPDHIAAGAALLPKGGHVGFHSKRHAEPWYIKAAQIFFAAIQ